jgi:hypothetical protein
MMKVVCLFLLFSGTLSQNFNVAFNNYKEKGNHHQTPSFSHFDGPADTFFDGTIQGFLEVDTVNKKPEALGFRIRGADLTALPTVAGPPSNFYPNFAGQAAHYKVLGGTVNGLVNYNPTGHAGYLVPHFDFHFLTEQREFYPVFGNCGSEPQPSLVSCADQARCDNIPADINPLFKNDDFCVPEMGNHLIVDYEPHESSGPRKFQSTWVMCTLEGKNTCLEPMITTEFIQRGQDVCFDIEKFYPASGYGKPGWYPKEYCVEYPEVNAGDYPNDFDVVLRDFFWQD